MPKPFISTRTMVGLRDGLEQRVGSRTSLRALREADLPDSALDTRRAYIPQPAQLLFLDLVARDAGVSNITFLLGPFADIRSYGAFGDYVVSANTFGDALRLTRDMMAFHASHDRLSLRRKGDTLRLTYHAALRHSDGYAHYAAMAVVVVLSIARPFLADRFLRGIEFNFPKPQDTAAFEDWFGCPVSFGSPELTVVYEAEAALRTRRAPPERLLTLGDVARDAFGPAPRGLVGAVEAVLRANIPDMISADLVARNLDLSERTLRRRLSEHGTSLRDLTRKIRLDSARELLTETDLDVIEIAQRVGYSDPSHFGRAFRQSTGMTPSDARGGLRRMGVAGNG